MTIMLNRVAEVRHLGGYRLWLRFRDGASGEVDLSSSLRFRGALEPLGDEDYFARVFVIEEAGTIGWPNDVDLDPDVLYSLATGAPLPTFEPIGSTTSSGESERSARDEQGRESVESRCIEPCGDCVDLPTSVISRFLGVVVTMNFSDHASPHFHVRYGEWRAAVTIDPPKLSSGRLPPRAVGFVTEWATLHRDELLANWELARTHQPLRAIEPLE